MNIRRADINDITGVAALLDQVAAVHAALRPDIFRPGTRKYSDGELEGIFVNDETPVFVAEENGRILGYAFCMLKRLRDSRLMFDNDTLYIDDLCVDETARGKGVGALLYEHAKAFARASNCSSVTLNVWEGNEDAKKFYQKMGLKPLSHKMEEIL